MACQHTGELAGVHWYFVVRRRTENISVMHRYQYLQFPRTTAELYEIKLHSF